jgi:hypothetical protein
MQATLTSRARRALVATAVAAVVLVGGIDAAGAGTAAKPRAPKSKPPALTLSGTGTWTLREFIGDAVVNGTGGLQYRNQPRERDVLVAGTVDADDGTLPGPDECESAVSTISAYGRRNVDFTMIGGGEVCGVHPQPPTSIVTHVFTGTFEVYDVTAGPRELLGTDGFFEVRLAEDGSASVFAIDT